MVDTKNGLPNSRPAPYRDEHDKQQGTKSQANEASLRKVERMAKKGQS
jgi:hypothetical protein